MKTKMKSAFAFIAVALMIMVAVVPMVSVFSDEADAAVAAVEYDNSVKTPIVIEGSIKENTTGLKNVPVVVSYTIGTVTALYPTVYTDDSGKYSVTTNTAVGKTIDEIKVVVNTSAAKVNGLANDAYGKAFPDVTVTKISKSIENLDVIADTAKVEGTLVTKDNGSTVYIGAAVTSTGTAISSVNAVNGAFSFYGKIGSEYILSANSSIGKFSADKFTLGPEGKTVALKAEKNIATITLATVPKVPTFTTVGATGDNYNGVASLGTAVIGTDGSTDYAYAVINYSSGTVPADKNLAATTFNVTYSGLTEEKTTITLSAATMDYDRKIVPADDSATSTLSYISKGDMTVGGIAVEPKTVKLTGKWTETSVAGVSIEGSKEFTAEIIGNKWYVQNFGGYTTATATVPSAPISFESTEIVGTHAGYTFNTLSGNGTFAATNAVKVSGAIDAFPTGVYDSAVTVAATNYVADADGLKLVKAVGSVTEKKTFEFYVPMNTNVTVNAPANYMPSKYVNDKVTADTVIETFVYNSSVEYTTYTGKITLNGTAVAPDTKENMIAVSYDGGITFVPADITVSITASEIKYKIKAAIATPITNVKISQLYKGGYEFNTELKTAATSGEGYYYVPVSITPTGEIPTIAVKTTDAYVKIANYGFDENKASALNDTNVKVTFYQSNSASSVGDAIGSSVAVDANGIAKATLAKPLVKTDLKAGDYRIYAVITDANGHVFTNTVGDKAAYLVTTFSDDELAATDVPITAKADAKKIFGYLKTESGIIGNVDYTYDVFASDKFIGTDKGKTVDGRFDLAYPDNATDIKLYVSGYGADVTGAPVLFNATTAGQFDKDVKVIPTVEKEYKVSYEGSYYDYVNVTTGNYAKGKVITLSAVSEFTIEDTENLYADGYTKYTFKAWYVNGKQISTDAITSYTVGDENIVVSADYTSEHVTVADGKQKDDGVDSNVMIIGIAAVVVALIAVVYAVIRKE